MFQTSKRLDTVLAELLQDEESHDRLGDEGQITTGYDNDGSTGRDMVEIGIGIGIEMAQKGPQYSLWLAKHPTEHVGWPIIAKDENEAEQILQNMAS